MKKYKILLFDLDDTLLDFKKGEDKALKELFKELDIHNPEEIIEVYKEINIKLWKDIEDGKLTRDYVLNRRFCILFEKYNRVVDGKEIEDKYRYYLNLQHELMDGAKELMDYLYTKYKLYAITNGVSEIQHKRMRDADITKYFDKVFISDNIGYQKPSREYFDKVMRYIPNFNKSEALVIGDSLNADILGGIQAGVDTCWFTPIMKEYNTDIKPTYVIHKLKDILKILNGSL